MLTVISPAKRLNESKPELPAGMLLTEPDFLPQAAALAKIAGKLSPAELRKLMDISEPLARLNADRFARWAKSDTFPAALMFAGDTYAGLEAKTLEPDAWRWAQKHLRILSGLYGLLRPLDRIAPYRLEMGSRIANPRGKDLYAYWGNRISKALNAAADETDSGALINCASVEYFSAVEMAALRLRVITPVFLEGSEDQAKIVSFWAKKARGAMARYIAENHLIDPKDIQGFSTGGYQFNANLSDGDHWAFLRAAA